MNCKLNCQVIKQASVPVYIMCYSFSSEYKDFFSRTLESKAWGEQPWNNTKVQLTKDSFVICVLNHLLFHAQLPLGSFSLGCTYYILASAISLALGSWICIEAFPGLPTFPLLSRGCTTVWPLASLCQRVSNRMIAFLEVKLSATSLPWPV